MARVFELAVIGAPVAGLSGEPPVKVRFCVEPSAVLTPTRLALLALAEVVAAS